MAASSSTISEDRHRERESPRFCTDGEGPRRWLAGAIGAAALAGWLVAACIRPSGVESTPEAARAELLSALGSVRLLEGRLSGVGYTRLDPHPRAIPARLARAARNMMRHLPSQPATERARDDALALAARGKLEDAAGILDAAPRHPGDAYVASDLAAIRLAIAAAGHDAYPALAALIAAEQAVGSSAAPAEARFNRALALETLGIDWEAIAAWRDYLAIDSHSGWAVEAHAHLAKLRTMPRSAPHRELRDRLDAAARAGKPAWVRALAADDPQGAREYVEQELLASWAEDFRNGGAVSGRQVLDEAREIGAALLERHGDAMASDAVGAIDAAAQAHDPDRLGALAAGHAAYRDAIAASLDLARSRRLLVRSARLLERGRSPFVSWARLQAAICDYRGASYRHALDALQRIEQASGAQYPSLRAKAWRVMGLAHAVLADYSRAGEALAESARLYRLGGETENLAALLTFLATIDQVLGDEAESWRVRCEALHLARRLPAPPYLLLSDSAVDLFSAGRPDIALYFQNEAVRQAELAGDVVLKAGSYRIRAAILHRLRQPDLARADVDRALGEVARVPDAGLRRSLRADLLVVAAQNAEVAEPGRAADLYQEALAVYAATGYHHYLAQLHQRCAAAYLAVSNLDAAERELRAAVGERERQRALLLEERARAAFVDGVRPVFDEMVEFQLARRRRPDRAFEYAERARARALLDLTAASGGPEADLARAGGEPPRPLPAAAIRRALAVDTRLIAYAVFDDATVAWVLGRDSLRGVMLPAGAHRLTSLVGELRREIGGRQIRAGAGAASAALFQALVAPLRDSIPDGSRLVFIPDKCLDLLPFAALFDPRSSRYLVEDHVLSVAPSATLFVRALQRDGRLSARPPKRILIVGAPEARGQGRLLGARQEAAAIHQLYGSTASQLLLGAEATRRAVLAALPGRDVVHFAGHALTDARSPGGPRIALADDPVSGEQGSLRLDDLFHLRLEQARLIVLAGCDTAGGPLSPSEGPLSLVRPFLAGGAPAVVAALWDTDDAAAARLSVTFHRHLRRGEDAATALRAAQLDLITDSDPVLRQASSWAAFELFGGVVRRGGG